MTEPGYKLDHRLERRRRRHLLLAVVPRLLDRHLRPVLGWRRFLFIPRLFLLAPGYRRRFARQTDDPRLKEVKRTFLLVGVLFNELQRRLGRAAALRTTDAFLYDLACAVQREAYLPPPQARTWEWFHREHEAQMAEGFIRTNDNDGVLHTPQRVSLHITRCRFHEAFRDMGEPRLTEAFCRSDETVFNEYSPAMRFHRGGEQPDTIARGAPRCTFIYERETP